MANFATFYRRVIFLILSVFLSSFLHRTTLINLNGSRFLYVFGILGLSPNKDHLWPFCFAIAFAKWQFLLRIKNCAIFGM